MHWNKPCGGVRFVIEAEPLLIENHMTVSDPSGDERVARLPDPTVHQSAHRHVVSAIAVDGFFYGIPQVRSLGI